METKEIIVVLVEEGEKPGNCPTKTNVRLFKTTEEANNFCKENTFVEEDYWRYCSVMKQTF